MMLMVPRFAYAFADAFADALADALGALGEQAVSASHAVTTKARPSLYLMFHLDW